MCRNGSSPLLPVSTRLILQLLVGKLADIIRLMAESAPVETVHLNYLSSCTHGCTYTIGEEDVSPVFTSVGRNLPAFEICLETDTISVYSFLDGFFFHR